MVLTFSVGKRDQVEFTAPPHRFDVFGPHPASAFATAGWPFSTMVYTSSMVIFAWLLDPPSAHLLRIIELATAIFGAKATIVDVEFPPGRLAQRKVSGTSPACNALRKAF